MGRSLNGNSVSAAVTTLSRTLGNVDSVIKDSTTSSQVAVTPGGLWAYDYSSTYDTANSFARNSVGEQSGFNSKIGVLQDELSNYTYIQGRAYYNNNYGMTGAVYDENLTQIYGWGNGSGTTSPYTGTLFCIRLYNSNLYFFSSNASAVYVTKIALPSGTSTTYTWNTLGGDWNSTNNSGAVFNWPINGKFWIYATEGSTSSYRNVILNFDIATNTFSQFGTTLTRNASNYLNSFFAMHVKADGTAVSLALYSPVANEYGVAVFTTSSSQFNATSTGGHWYIPPYGYYTIFCSSNKQLCPVTTHAVIDYNIVNYAPGGTYYNYVGHMQGGDGTVQVESLAGPSGANQYPFSNNMSPNPSLTTRDQFMVGYLNVSGTFAVSRNNGSLVVGSRRSIAYVNSSAFGAIASKLPDPTVIALVNNNVQSGSTMWLQTAYIYTADSTTSYTFASSVSGNNAFSASYVNSGYATSFVTSTGKFFMMPTYNNQSNRSIAYIVQGALPLFIPATTKTYNVVVVGGGGASSGSDGSASLFAGLAASPGTVRDGFVSGSTVLTSGPTRGTGGTGYGADGWGQGEDTGSAGSYGGGSGRVTTGTVTLVGGAVYPYRAGFGPRYGKQGAVLLSEV